MSLHVSARNPLRPVDWRWKRAIEICERSGPNASRRRDTPVGFSWIKRAAVFNRRYSLARTDMELEAVADDFPDILWAYRIWEAQNNYTKWSVEAHLLAREDDFEVGYRCGVSPDIVEAYEALFFNVREKLHHRKYILHCVMGPSVQRGLLDREQDLLWKLYGYNLGPHVLDALEDNFANPMWCGTPEAVNASFQDNAVSTLKMKSAVAAMTVPVDRSTQLALLEQFTKFVEVERTTDSTGKAQEQILEHIAAMMTTLPFDVDGRDPRHGNVRVHRGSLEPFARSAVELTYEETMRVSVRSPIANEQTLLALSFPKEVHALPAPGG